MRAMGYLGDLPRKVLRRVFLLFKTENSGLKIQRIGTDYGGWAVPVEMIDREWVCYCGGVGEDISFDLGLIELLGCSVWAYDPTPRAIAHVEKTASHEPRFHFTPVGFWSHAVTLKFYAPKNPAHVSHSVLNLQSTDSYFEAACISVAEAMRMNSHLQIDLLKLDIEGAEHTVLPAMLSSDIRPKVVCFEIDQPAPLLSTLRTMVKVLTSGYVLVHAYGWNFTLIRKDLLS